MNKQRNYKTQRGAVLITVMVFMVVLMLLASGVTNYFLTSEDREVEGLLADVRTYWAEIGHVNYMLSRLAASGLCGQTGNSDTTTNLNANKYCGGTGLVDDDDPAISSRTTKSPAGSLQSYLDGDPTPTTGAGRSEIQSGGLYTNPGKRQWFYPQYTDVTSNYSISVQAVVRDHLDINDYELRVDVSVVGSGTAPAAYSLKDQPNGITVGFCVVDSQKVISGPLTGAYDNRGCGTGDATASSDKSKEGTAMIEFIMRNNDPGTIK